VSDPHTPLSRRAFLAGAGAAGLAVAAGCSSNAKTATTKAGTVTAPPPPLPRDLAAAIRGPVIKRGSPGFAAAAEVYNDLYDSLLPEEIARPVDPMDVQAAVRWLVEQNVQLRARSGGHSYAGYSTLDGGAVLDLRNLNTIAVDSTTRTATVGAGAQLIDVYSALSRKGVTIPAGSCPSVGVGGHALGGGMGLAGRAFGLATDNILAAEIVTADGRLWWVDDSSDRDLLWALRGGGGGNFGLVTRLRFRVHAIPRSASWFIVNWPWSSASDALAAWLQWAPRASDALNSIFHLQTGPGVLVAGQYMGPAADLAGLLAPLTNVGGGTISSGDQDYMGIQIRWAGCLGRSLEACHTIGASRGGMLERASFRAKSDYVVTPLSDRGRAVLVRAIEQRQGLPGSGAILFDCYGGAINRVAPDATAFVHRNALACIQYLSYNGGASWLESTYGAMRPYVSGMAYQNYIDPGLQGWQDAYYGANYERLVGVQRRVDPNHYFRFPQAIGS
jgi:FAD/FMN-containing dehydrogenase